MASDIKLFVEGKGDAKFLKDIVQLFFKKVLKEKDDIVDLRGYTNISANTGLFQINTKKGGINLLIIDADTANNKGGYAKRRADILALKTTLGIEFELFMLPNDEDDGDLEVLLERIINPKHQAIFECFKAYEDCLKVKNSEYIIPARKAKIYGYMEAVGVDSEKAKEEKRDYLNVDHWSLAGPNPALKPLIDFLSKYFSAEK